MTEKQEKGPHTRGRMRSSVWEGMESRRGVEAKDLR
jgi:hypothetical protein